MTEPTTVGIIGHPVSHSLSPAMHGAEFARLGLNWKYEAWDIAPENLEKSVRELIARGVRGFNVTIPHKVAVMPLLASVEYEAELVGAVNTVICGDGVATLVARCNAAGLAAPTSRPGGRPPIRYGPEQAERILREVQRTPEREADGTTWSRTTVQRALRRAPDGLRTVSPSTIRRVRHETGFRWQRDRTWCASGVVVRRRKHDALAAPDLGEDVVVVVAVQRRDRAGRAEPVARRAHALEIAGPVAQRVQRAQFQVADVGRQRVAHLHVRELRDRHGYSAFSEVRSTSAQTRLPSWS